ncbi:hypothetical protein ACFVAJ_18065 [Agromyces sp. NPDC057679]|uniref:hypothetical protein n=1 Tax=Agromyces sp. NPDC057679 TaxID=3346207 RepID=UPI003671A54A
MKNSTAIDDTDTLKYTEADLETKLIEVLEIWSDRLLERLDIPDSPRVAAYRIEFGQRYVDDFLLGDDSAREAFIADARALG